MNNTIRRGLPPGALLAVAAGVLGLGCSGPPDAVTPEGTAVQGRLTAVHTLYAKHVEKKQRPPANADELNAFGRALPSVEGGPVVLTEEFLVSPRDKKPIAVRYGVRPPPAPPRPTNPDVVAGKAADGPVLAHEQDGARGRRFVVYAGSGRIEEVDAARFKELIP